MVEVDQAESRKPFSLRSNTVLTSTTTMLLFYVFMLMTQQQALNLQIPALCMISNKSNDTLPSCRCRCSLWYFMSEQRYKLPGKKVYQSK
jgi:hypothetical protein